MKQWIQGISFGVLLLLIAIAPINVLAEEGLPGSPEFGYGACLDIEGYHIERSIELANNYDLDWITINFNWGRYQSQPNTQPDWSALDRAISTIDNTQISVMISITNAPQWAMDATGPNIDSTIALTLGLLQRYPNNILALEFFPAANTSSGWGAAPNPKAYAKLLKGVQFALNNQGFNQTIIAAGIEPSPNREQSIQYLRDLYAAGISTSLSIISLRLPSIAYAPGTHPEEVSGHTLRFYEDARKIMLDNGHQNGLLWITRFDWHPDQFNQPNAQAEWLQYAYINMRAQLYIGTASIYCLNDPFSSTSLISTSGKSTMAFNALGELIAAENNSVSITHLITSGNSAQSEESQPTTP